MDEELKTRLIECLNEALEADSYEQTKYHIRQALQLVAIEETESDKG